MNKRGHRMTLFTPPVEVAEADTFAMVSLWRVLKRGKFTIAAVTFLFGLLGIWLALSSTDSYAAETLVVLDDSSAAVAAVQGAAAPTSPSAAVEVFGTRRLITRVVDEMGLRDDPEFNPYLTLAETPAPPSLIDRIAGRLAPQSGGADTDQAADQIAPDEDTLRQIVVANVQEAVSIQVEPPSTLIRVRTIADDPVMAAALANAVSEAFLDEVVSDRIASFERLANQLGQRIAELRVEVREREEVLQDALRQSGPIASGQIDAFGAEVERMRERLAQTEIELDAARRLTEQLAELDGLSGKDLEIAILASDTLSAMDGAPGGPDESSPDLFAALEREAQAEFDRVSRRASTMQAALSELETRAAARSNQLLMLQQLQRDAAASSEILDASVRQLSELSLISSVGGAGGRIIAPADTPLEARGNGGIRNTVILTLLGLIVSVGWVLIREANNPRLRTVPDVSAMVRGVTVFPLPAARRRTMKRPGALRGWLTTSADAQPFLDAVRRIRGQVLAAGQAEKAMVIQITSDGLAQDKSQIAIAMAFVTGLVGNRTLLIEGDMRKREVQHHLGADNAEIGLATLLSEPGQEADGCIQHLDDMGIDVLFAGATNASPADLLEKPAFAAMINELRGTYDVIVINAPDLLAAPEVGAIAARSDHTIAILESNCSTRDTVAEMLQGMTHFDADRFLVALSGAPLARRRA